MVDNIDEIIGSIHLSFKHIISMHQNDDKLDLYKMINLYYDLMMTVGKMVKSDDNSTNSELDTLNKLLKEIQDGTVNIYNYNEYKQNYGWAHYNLSHTVGIYDKKEETLNDNTLFMLCKDYYVQGVATQHALLLRSKLTDDTLAVGLDRYIERTIFMLQQAKKHISTDNLETVSSDLTIQKDLNNLFNKALIRCIEEIHSEKLSKLIDYQNDKLINI